MPNSAQTVAQRFAVKVLIIVLAALAVFALWYHFPKLSPSDVIADTINFIVAIGTLSLALATFHLAKYTLQSVRASESIIGADNLRHEQSLAPILTTKVVITDDRISGVEIKNAGLGPALEISINRQRAI